MKNNLDNNQFLEIKILFLSACEELCNRALRYDEASRQAFAALEGKALSINTYLELPFARPQFDFYISFCEHGLLFSALNHDTMNDAADVTIEASSFQLVSRLLSQKDLLDGVVDIQGDRALVSHIQSILFNLDLDWEEPLSAITGDIVAHELNRFAHDAVKWIKNSGNFVESLLSRSSPYTAQKKQSVKKNNVDTFKRDVAELSKLQEQLSLRVQQLTAKYLSANSRTSDEKGGSE